MNKMERALYIRGLENLYSSVLLGEEQTLEQVERLIYLTRELSNEDTSMRPIEEELENVRQFCKSCWPDNHIRMETESMAYGCLVRRGRLSGALCTAMAETSGDRPPEELSVWKEDGCVHYRLMSGGRICAKGEIHDE